MQSKADETFLDFTFYHPTTLAIDLKFDFYSSRTRLHKTFIASSGWHLLNLDFGKLLDLSADVSN